MAQSLSNNNAASLRKMLDAMPLRNARATVEPDGPEGLRIAVAMEKKPFTPPLSWIVPTRKRRTVRLDKLGAQIWNLCDGERTVERVVDAFAEKHRLTFHESRVSVTECMKQLLRRGALAMALEGEAAAAADETKREGQPAE